MSQSAWLEARGHAGGGGSTRGCCHQTGLPAPQWMPPIVEDDVVQAYVTMHQTPSYQNSIELQHHLHKALHLGQVEVGAVPTARASLQHARGTYEHMLMATSQASRPATRKVCSSKSDGWTGRQASEALPLVRQQWVSPELLHC
jgi:hypothetical protein